MIDRTIIIFNRRKDKIQPSGKRRGRGALGGKGSRRIGKSALSIMWEGGEKAVVDRISTSGAGFASGVGDLL